MKIQNVKNNQSFKAGLKFHVLPGRINHAEEKELKNLAAKIGTSKDLIDVTIMRICKADFKNPKSYYGMDVETTIGNTEGSFTLGQAKVLAQGEELPTPYQVLKPWLINLAEKCTAAAK